MGSQPGVHGASPLVAREEGRISQPQAEVMTDRRGGGDEQRLSPHRPDVTAGSGRGAGRLEIADHLASNCSAAFLVGKAGLLEGRRVTTYRGGEEELQVQFPEAEVSADDVVVDGGLISSSGEVVSYQAALALLAELAGEDAADRVAADLYIRWLSLPSRRGRLPGRPALPDRRWRRGGGGPPPCGR